MGKYMKKQFQVSQLFLEHHRPSDFCTSCWQKSNSGLVLPLLCVRVIIFLACLFILAESLYVWSLEFHIGYWFIFLTSWGVVMNTIASFFAVAISLRVYLKGPLEPLCKLPWYVKAFWACYDIAVMMSYFITLYYFTLLPQDYEGMWIWDIINDLLTHGVTSVLMFSLLMTSRLPGRMLHFVYPLCFGLVYVIFSLIYFFAGGTSPFGEHYIYPSLDWENPGATIFATIVTAILIVIMHQLVVGMAACRNWLFNFCRRPDSLDKPIS